MKIIERELTKSELEHTYREFERHAAEWGNPPESDQRLTFIAEQEGNFIGCASGLINENGNWFYLTDLFVEENERGEGLGSRLLRKIEAKAATLGAQHAWTRTAGYEAPAFYMKHGYTTFFELENWYRSGHAQVGLRKRL